MHLIFSHLCRAIVRNHSPGRAFHYSQKLFFSLLLSNFILISKISGCKYRLLSLETLCTSAWFVRKILYYSKGSVMNGVIKKFKNVQTLRLWPQRCDAMRENMQKSFVTKRIFLLVSMAPAHCAVATYCWDS